MRTYEGFLTLVAELDGDLREIQRLLPRNAKAWERIAAGADDPVDWGALGFTIQSLYGVLENYFLRIAKFFENGLPADRWHKALVERMAIDIPGLRPALLPSREAARDVEEVLRFRHRLRNLYGEDLDPQKTTEIQRTVIRLFGGFPDVHEQFKTKLMAIAERVR